MKTLGKLPGESAPLSLNVLGYEFNFKRGSDMGRATRIAAYLDERYADWKSRSKVSKSKDIILTFLAFELADELLQMKTERAGSDTRIRSLLEKIEKSL